MGTHGGCANFADLVSICVIRVFNLVHPSVPNPLIARSASSGDSNAARIIVPVLLTLHKFVDPYHGDAGEQQ
jgi:hypothetical protein